MSVQALSCAFAIRGISSSEKLVLLALANYANDKMVCWPSQERLAADTELSDRTVWASLKALEVKRLLSRVSRKRSDGTRATDVFTLHFALTVTTEPLANPAKTTRKVCEDQSQFLQEPVAVVATLTTFEPPLEEPSVEPIEGARPRPARPKPTRRCPEDWEPDELTIARLVKEGYSPGQLERALAMVRDHEFGKAHSDWGAVFRNWVRRELAMAPKSPASFTDKIASENAEARRKAFEQLDAQDGPKN